MENEREIKSTDNNGPELPVSIELPRQVAEWLLNHVETNIQIGLNLLTMSTKRGTQELLVDQNENMKAIMLAARKTLGKT